MNKHSLKIVEYLSLKIKLELLYARTTRAQ